MLSRRNTAAACIAAVTVLALAACGSGGSSGTTTSSNGSGTPQRGGTLKMLGITGNDFHSADPAGQYFTTDYMLADLIQRQLVEYPRNVTTASFGTTPVGDAATVAPTVANGGITDGGKTYTFHIKPTAKWQTGAPVTSTDFIRGIARVCNAVYPFGNLPYWTSTIVGFDSFCTGEQKLPASAAAYKSYITKNLHKVTGMQAPNPSTLVFHLLKPTSFFLNILALPDASAVPASYLNYLPHSPALSQHFVSDGPYELTKFNQGVEYDFKRNPEWVSSTDPNRPAYVDNIQVITNLTQEAVQQQIQAGTADMEWNTFPSPVQASQLHAQGDPGLNLGRTSSSNPYMVMNTVSPTSGGALKKLQVRQAVEYAVNPTTVIQALGGPLLNTPLHQVLPSEISGSSPQYNLYPYNPTKAKQLLSAAGYPNGVQLKLVYTSGSTANAKLAQTLQSDLKAGGFNIKLVPAKSVYDYTIQNPPVTRKGNWDLALAGWGADWDGNAAITYMGPLFDGPASFAQAGSNFGDWNDPKVVHLINQALAAQTEQAAAPIWHQADVQVMKDAAIVPLTNPKTANYYNSHRVHNFMYFDNFQNGDPTQVWLSK